MSRHDGPYVSMGLVTSRAAFSSDASQYDDLIRSDFALRRGGAGGALLDITGEVVGINTALVRLGGGTRVSLSQPVGVFAPIAQQLALRGAVRPAWLGLTLRAPDPAVRPALGGWPSSGAQVATVAARSPAAHAGLRVGDVLLAIDGDPAAGNSWLRARLLARGPGAAVALTFARRQCDIALPAGRAQLASVVPRGPLPGERSGDAAANSVCVLQPHRAVVRLASPPALPTHTLRLEPSEGPLGGVTLTQMPARSRRADSATVDGAVELRVAEVVALSPASRLGLAVGDRLVAREGSPIRSVRRFVARYRREAGPLVLTVARGERTRLIVTAQ